MKTAIEIYKLLPKTNCGTCGTPTCFGFAAKVAARMAPAAACANLSDETKAELAGEETGPSDARGTVYDQALASLRPKVEALDFRKTAETAGAAYLGPDALELPFLNDRYRITRERIVGPDGQEPLPFLSILIYNHLCMPDMPAPAGEWITFGSVPASHAKDKAWAGHVEEVIARHFTGKVDQLREASARLGGAAAAMPGNHDAAFEFRFFPRYPALLLFFDAVPDEDFPAQCKLLLDRNVNRYLDIESIVVLGEEFAARLAGGGT